jgi:hypothetical protein
MSTPKEVAAMLRDARANVGSYRKLAKLIGIPAGTLCRIVKTDGDYLPKVKRYRLVLGVKSTSKPRAGKTIQSMSRKEIEYLFAHRLEI